MTIGQNQEYQKLYAEYERTMSMSKKERMKLVWMNIRRLPCADALFRILLPKGLSLDTCPKLGRYPAFGRTSCRPGSRTSIATITVRKNSSALFNAKPARFLTARVRAKVPFLSDVPISLLSVPSKSYSGELVMGELLEQRFHLTVFFVMPESVSKKQMERPGDPEELEIQWQQIIDKTDCTDCPHDENNELQPQCLPFDKMLSNGYGWQV